MAKASAKVRNFLLVYRQVAVFFILHLYFGYHKSNFSAEIAQKKSAYLKKIRGFLFGATKKVYSADSSAIFFSSSSSSPSV